jgi:hypothetical protein
METFIYRKSGMNSQSYYFSIVIGVAANKVPKYITYTCHIWYTWFYIYIFGIYTLQYGEFKHLYKQPKGD